MVEIELNSCNETMACTMQSMIHITVLGTRTTWERDRQMRNEMTKIRDDMWVWRWTSAGESALERGDGDTRIERKTRNMGGKKDMGIST